MRTPARENAVGYDVSPDVLEVPLDDVEQVRQLRLQWSHHKEKLRGMVDMVDTALPAGVVDTSATSATSASVTSVTPVEAPVFDGIFSPASPTTDERMRADMLLSGLPSPGPPPAPLRLSPIGRTSVAAHPSSPSASAILHNMNTTLSTLQRSVEREREASVQLPQPLPQPVLRGVGRPQQHQQQQQPQPQQQQQPHYQQQQPQQPPQQQQQQSTRRSVSPERVRMAVKMAESGYWHNHASPYLTPQKRGSRVSTPTDGRTHTRPERSLAQALSPPSPEEVIEERARFNEGHGAVLGLAIKHAQQKQRAQAKRAQKAAKTASNGEANTANERINTENTDKASTTSARTPLSDKAAEGDEASGYATPTSPAPSSRTEQTKSPKSPKLPQHDRPKKKKKHRHPSSPLHHAAFTTLSTKKTKVKKGYELPESAKPVPKKKVKRTPRVPIESAEETAAGTGRGESVVRSEASTPLYPELHSPLSVGRVGPVGVAVGHDELANEGDTISDSNASSGVYGTPPDEELAAVMGEAKGLITPEVLPAEPPVGQV